MNKTLCQDHIDIFVSLSPPRVYKTQSDIIYEGHVPTAGYLLLSGEIHFLKKNKIIQVIHKYELFGVKEIMNNCPLAFTVRILPQSIVCILDKSTIQEILAENEMISNFF